jgi:hypothetical protein
MLILPATHFTTTAEDGIGIEVADEALRAEITRQYREARARIERRRRFMTVVIGIDLKPEIRPLTNIPA